MLICLWWCMLGGSQNGLSKGCLSLQKAGLKTVRSSVAQSAVTGCSGLATVTRHRSTGRSCQKWRTGSGFFVCALRGKLRQFLEATKKEMSLAHDAQRLERLTERLNR